ncbi:MAG: FAD-dependent oxidoreductase [Bacillota bacterium]|nr:FAD-dependent oxidoreductase [Bacillota bacterium]
MVQKVVQQIDAKGIYYRELNEMIRQSVEKGSRHIRIINVRGQRYLSAGLTEEDLLLEIEGVPGDDLAFCLGGPTVKVYGHGQNAIANTMDSGKVYVHGMGGDALAYGMRGGKLFIRDNVGYRVGIHMKEYKDSKPAIVIGGTTGDFLGEYMAGGTILILNSKNITDNVAGQADKTLATGIHGGEIYIFNYEIPDYMPGIGAVIRSVSKKESETIRPLVEEFCDEFDFNSNELLERDLVKIEPAGSRPFSKFYYPAYPVNTGLVPVQKEMASPCESNCPVGIPTGRFLGHIRHGEYSEALELIDSYTPFRYSNCGFICAYLCMDACSRGKIDFSVRTAELARGFHGKHKVGKIGEHKGKIIIIGAGPAGLSSAYFLARLGYDVEIYEAGDQPGGKMYQVISRKRLPLEDLDRDIKNITDLGIKFHFNQRVNSKLFKELMERADHIIVAIGAHHPLLPPVKGRELIKGGIDFLKSFNLGEEIKIGPRAVLIGCGDAALDGMEALSKLGLKPNQITAIDIQTPSAKPEELQKWVSAGVEVMYPYFLEEVVEEGVVVRDSTGSKTFLPGDAIAFINEKPKLDFLPADLTDHLNARGFFETLDDTGATTHPNISITGDAVGLGLVANSIRKGRECANRIHASMQGEVYKPEIKEAIDPFDLRLHTNRPYNDPEEITIREEYTRCLHCGICVRCDECVEACPREARTREGTTFTIDLSKCGGCGTCAATCRGGVIRMVPRDKN